MLFCLPGASLSTGILCSERHFKGESVLGSRPWSPPPQDLPRTGPFAIEIVLKVGQNPAPFQNRDSIGNPALPWCLPGASQAVQLILSCLPGASQAVQLILSCLAGASQAVQMVPSCFPVPLKEAFVPALETVQLILSCLPGASQAVQMVLSCFPGASQAVQLILSCLPGLGFRV